MLTYVFIGIAYLTIAGIVCMYLHDAYSREEDMRLLALISLFLWLFYLIACFLESLFKILFGICWLILLPFIVLVKPGRSTDA